MSFKPEPELRLDRQIYGDVPWNRLTPGVVVYAHVPFHDAPEQSKMRPCVVIEKNPGRRITVCPIYTKESPFRIETYRRGRRGFIDKRAVILDEYNLVNLDPIELDDSAWDILADCVVFPEVESESIVEDTQ